MPENIYWLLGGQSKKGDNFGLNKKYFHKIRAYIYGKNISFFKKILSSKIRYLGFDNLNIYKESINDSGSFSNVKIEEYNYEVPNFLITQKIPNETTKLLIKKSLFFTRSVLLNKFFIPNNLIFPKSRVILENYFN